MDELKKEMDEIENYLDKIAWDKEKASRGLGIIKEIRILAKETGTEFKEKIGSEWSSKEFDIEDSDDGIDS